jgi:hypothetical protein
MALQTAFANFTNILFHTGGQGVAYNRTFIFFTIA